MSKELTDDDKKYFVNYQPVTKEQFWFTHYNIIKSKFLSEMVKYVSDETYKISWEVLRVFAEYAQKHFESLTE